MKLQVEDLAVLFPYDYVYPEQYQYMLELKRSLDAQGHCVLEMPSGTGKTVSLLALIVAYQIAHPDFGKLIYCSRTVPELEKVLVELKRLTDYYAKVNGEAPKLLGVGLSSRKNMCVHPKVGLERDGKTVDSMCRNMTASWVRDLHRGSGSGDGGDDPMEIDGQNDSVVSDSLCEFYEGFDQAKTEIIMPKGIFDLADLQEYGKQKKWWVIVVLFYMCSAFAATDRRCLPPFIQVSILPCQAYSKLR